MQTVTLARHAMATRFELVLHGTNTVALRAAGEEALDEVARLENQLSLYRPGSEIARINARAAYEAVTVSPEVFALLQQARRLTAETDGAFDVTIAPLVHCWGFMGGNGRMPTPEEVAAARECVGMDKVLLDAANRTVRFARTGVMLDLGAIGKGYAIERAVSLLREAGVTSGLIHGGTSTVGAIGRPPGADAWEVAIDVAAELKRQVAKGREPGEPQHEGAVAAEVPPAPRSIKLCDEALSVSAAWGRCFDAAGKLLGHVIDPRTGCPVEKAVLAAVALPAATETDPLSTALLAIGRDGLSRISSLRPKMKTLVVHRLAGCLELSSTGF